MAVKPLGNFPVSPSTIKMRSDDTDFVASKTQQEADAGRARIGDHESGNNAPYVTRMQQEIEAGRARVRDHEGRERMLAGKREAEGSEESRVDAAKKANSDL